MNRRSFTRLFFIAVTFLTLASQFSAQKLSVDTSKQTVYKFLSAWLVRKDTESAIKFFSPKALLFVNVLDGYGLNEYISEAKNSDTTKLGIIRFLNDYNHCKKANSLGNILFLESSDSPETSKNISAMLSKKSFNRPLKDNYYLVNFDLLPKKWRRDYRNQFKNRFDLSDAFINVIQYRVLNEDERYGDDTFLFIAWARDSGLWKIIQIAVIDVEGT